MRMVIIERKYLVSYKKISTSALLNNLYKNIQLQAYDTDADIYQCKIIVMVNHYYYHYTYIYIYICVCMCVQNCSGKYL